MIITNEEKYNRASTLLRGSSGYKIACILSFVFALVLAFWGIAVIDTSSPSPSEAAAGDTGPTADGQQHCQRRLLEWSKMSEIRIISILSILYLISSTFTLAKTIRDDIMSRTIGLNRLLAGTTAWWYQSVISFVLALLSCLYAAFSMDVPWIVRAFILIGLSFALSSTIFLSKVIRDHQDASYFEEQEEAQAAAATAQQDENNTDAQDKTASSLTHSYDMIVDLCVETHFIYAPITWCLFLLDSAAFFYALYQFHLDMERYELLVMGVIFTVYAALILAKAVRDQASKENILHPTNLHWFLYIAAPVISCGLTFDSILFEMPLTVEHKAFLALNVLCILSVTFSLAKVIRDRQEIDWLQNCSQ